MTRTVPRRRRAAGAAAVLALGLAAGCSGTRPEATSPAPEATSPAPTATPTPTTASGAPGRLPPESVERLRPIIDGLVGPLGLRLTRGALVERATGAPGPGARHLALYVEPTVARTDVQLVRAIVPLAAAVTPFVFRQWPDLESYDICQEPPPGVDDRPVPETVTVLDVTRAYSDQVDWDRVELSTLVADTRSRRPGIVVAVAERLQPVLRSVAG